MPENIQETFRIRSLPPYLLGPIARSVTDARLAGRDIVDLSQINPDMGPPSHALDKLVQAVLLNHNHRYSASQGISRLREAFAVRYASTFGVTLDPDTQVAATLGSKEGITHLLLALLFPGENVLLPTPCYPVHAAGVFIAGGSSIQVPLYSDWDEAAANDYTLDEHSDSFFERLEIALHRTWPRPKAMIVSFPHNPTTTIVTPGFFQRLVDMARSSGLYILHDFAYADICFSPYQAPSILAARGALDCAVEFYSLSKGFNMPGWRIGCCAGNADLTAALKRIKSYIDFGSFQPLQIGALHVLLKPGSVVQETQQTYEARRDVLLEGLRSLDFEVHLPAATAFVWGRIPQRYRTLKSMEFCRRVLDQCDVALCPGAGFDPAADDFVRFSLVETENRIRKGLERMAQSLGSGGSL